VERLSQNQIAALEALAKGIIPGDQRDAGVSALNAGEHLAKKLEVNPFSSLLMDGVRFAESESVARFGQSVDKLSPEALHQLLGVVRDRAPALFKFVRMETCALYLSQPKTWERIGFPGPSIEQGGYPDFDREQQEG